MHSPKRSTPSTWVFGKMKTKVLFTRLCLYLPRTVLTRKEEIPAFHVPNTEEKTEYISFSLPPFSQFSNKNPKALNHRHDFYHCTTRFQASTAWGKNKALLMVLSSVLRGGGGREKIK